MTPGPGPHTAPKAGRAAGAGPRLACATGACTCEGLRCSWGCCGRCMGAHGGGGRAAPVGCRVGYCRLLLLSADRGRAAHKHVAEGVSFRCFGSRGMSRNGVRAKAPCPGQAPAQGPAGCLGARCSMPRPAARSTSANGCGCWSCGYGLGGTLGGRHQHALGSAAEAHAAAPPEARTFLHLSLKI